MITEDYCSYEVAKLLKEKGFDEQCRAAYTNYGKLFTTQIQQYVTNVICSKGTLWDCTAPTLQMAMKWLREEHSIAIEPMLLSHGWFCQIEKILEDFCKEYIYETDNYKTYEEAVESALKYCLENLI